MKVNAEKFIEFVKEHGFRVFAALVTGSLTYYAGMTVSNNVAYALTLVILAEGMSLYWPYRLESAQDVGTRSNINLAGVAQWASAGIGIVLAWVSIILTDVASAVFVAVANGYAVLTAFRSVPQWSQEVVVYVLPVLAFTHGLLLTIFYIASPDAAHARAIRAIERDGNQKIRIASANAERARVNAYTAQYEREARGMAERKGQRDADEALTARYQADIANPTNGRQTPPQR